MGAYSLYVRNEILNSKNIYQYIAKDKADHIITTVNNVILRTGVMNALIQDHNGGTEFFDAMADNIYDDVLTQTGIKLEYIAIAPEGVVSDLGDRIAVQFFRNHHVLQGAVELDNPDGSVLQDFIFIVPLGFRIGARNIDLQAQQRRCQQQAEQPFRVVVSIHLAESILLYQSIRFRPSAPSPGALSCPTAVFSLCKALSRTLYCQISIPPYGNFV